MVETKSFDRLGLTDAELLKMLRKMLEMRLFEENVEKLYQRGKTVRPVHLYLGEEAIGVGVASALGANDTVVTTYRGHGHALAREVPPKEVMGEILGRSTGTCKGLGGSMHAAISAEHGIPLATAIVGSGVPIAAGLGLANQLLNRDNVVAVFFGDGAVNTGAFHEGLNLAVVWKLPVLLACENNLYAQYTPHKTSFGGKSIAERAAGYGVRSAQVFGNDVMKVRAAAQEAVRSIKENGGPYFIEFKTYRKKGHAVFDTAAYRPKEEVDEWMKMDPIELFSSQLSDAGILKDGMLQKWREELEAELTKIVEEALVAPAVPFDTLAGLVYA